jgi:hypothetical protein
MQRPGCLYLYETSTTTLYLQRFTYLEKLALDHDLIVPDLQA